MHYTDHCVHNKVTGMKNIQTTVRLCLDLLKMLGKNDNLFSQMVA